MQVQRLIMDKRGTGMPTSVFRASRVAVHVVYGLLLAVPYPHLDQTGQRRIIKTWSRQLLAILNIGIRTEGIQPANGEGGCLIVANHVSWLDIYVLNALHPALFIAKSELRSWPVIGWLSIRCGTIFIERALRRNAALVNRRMSHLLKQGASIGLFPEGTTTDGKQVGHFHSALIQPAIDAGARVCPMALRYQHENGEPGVAAVFIGDTTLLKSIWRILRCPQLNALVVYTPALQAAGENRRILARTAQAVIAQALQNVSAARHANGQHAAPTIPTSLLSSRSAYALLIDPQPHNLPR
jgi:1-acyl-sn-glycerol-3-phosphate acyltransferase